MDDLSSSSSSSSEEADSRVRKNSRSGMQCTSLTLKRGIICSKPAVKKAMRIGSIAHCKAHSEGNFIATEGDRLNRVSLLFGMNSAAFKLK